MWQCSSDCMSAGIELESITITDHVTLSQSDPWIQSHDCTLNVLLHTEACNKLLFTFHNHDHAQPVAWTVAEHLYHLMVNMHLYKALWHSQYWSWLLIKRPQSLLTLPLHFIYIHCKVWHKHYSLLCVVCNTNHCFNFEGGDIGKIEMRVKPKLIKS